jgi:WD40 repeat protein
MLILWDVASRRRLNPLLTGHITDLVTVSFSPDGRMLASGSRDNTVLYWTNDFAAWRDQACRHVGRNLTAQEREQYLDARPSPETCPNLHPD